MLYQQRVTLTDPATLALRMRQHVEAVAQSILTDTRADRLFADCLAASRRCHSYSVRNRLLIAWQCPESRRVASLGAFGRIAADQGAEPITINGKRRHVLVATGSRAAWIWGHNSTRTELRDALTGEERVEVAIRYIPVAVWPVESVVYAATREPLVLPDHVQPIDAALYAGLIAFAAHQGIAVEHRGLLGARGVSHGGRISLQCSDSEALQLPVLAHEVMHELLHHASDSRHLPKPVVEGEAETGMAVIMKHFGHDAVTSPQYLRNHGVQPKDVLNSMDRILRATGQVIEFIEGREAAA